MLYVSESSRAGLPGYFSALSLMNLLRSVSTVKISVEELGFPIEDSNHSGLVRNSGIGQPFSTTLIAISVIVRANLASVEEYDNPKEKRKGYPDGSIAELV